MSREEVGVRGAAFATGRAGPSAFDALRPAFDSVHRYPPHR